MAYGFIIPRIMLVYYGSEINGLVSSINQIITYLNFAEAGLAGAAVFALYKPLADRDIPAINGVVSAAKKFYDQSGCLFTALIALTAAVYPLLKPVEGLSYAAGVALVLALGAKGFMEFFTLAKYRALLTADQRTYVISNASSVYVVLNAIVITIMAMLRCNIALVYTVALSAVFVRTGILVRYAKKHYGYLDFSVTQNRQALNKRWDAFILQILGAVHSGAPIVIATALFSLTEVSVFSIYQLVLTGLNNLLGIFTSGLGASFGDVIARGEQPTLQRAARDFELAYYCLISVVYAVAFAAIQPFISLYTSGVTDANYFRPELGAALVLNGLLFSLKVPQAMIVTSAGHYRETRWRTATQALLIVGCGAVLAKIFGLPGIAIGTCIGNIYRDIDLAFYTPRRLTKTRPIDTGLRMIWCVATSALCVAACSLARVNVTNYAEWIWMALLYCLISGAVTLLSALVLHFKGVQSIMLRVKCLIKK